MADLIPWSNLLPTYNSPNQLAQQNASIQNTQASTQQTQAQTGLIGEQTQAADIANQGSQLSLGALKQAYANGIPGPSSPGGGGSGGDDEVYPGVSGDSITDHAIKNFAPIPTAPPPALQQQATLLAMGGRPESAKAILDNYATQVGGANQQRQLQANTAYQHASEVSGADGYNFALLSRYYPNQADMIKQAHPDATPDELNADAKSIADHMAIASHQYTGRPTDIENGVLIDKPSGKPVPGQTQVLTGLDAGEKQKAFEAANEVVTMKQGLQDVQVPKWQQAGYPSAEAFVVAADKAARTSANQPPPGGPPATPSQIPPPSAPQQPTAAPAPKAAPAAPPAVTDPALKAALADPEYKLQSTPSTRGVSATPGQIDQDKATVAARTELLSDAQNATNSGSQAMQYLSAAKAIMDSKGAPVTGPMGALIAKASAAVGGADASNYQEVAKYLGNAAIQAGKGNFGKGMTQNDVTLQKEELSPSVHMTDGALNDLLSAGIKNTQYAIDSAKRVKPYLVSGNDPQSFAQWNDTHFNRTATVNTPPAKSAAAGVPPDVQALLNKYSGTK